MLQSRAKTNNFRNKNYYMQQIQLWSYIVWKQINFWHLLALGFDILYVVLAPGNAELKYWFTEYAKCRL